MIAQILAMAREMPVRCVARMLHVHDTRLWRVIGAMVAEAREDVDMSGVKQVILDETKRSKGQTYVSLFMEPGTEAARVLYATPGRDHTTVTRFAEDLTEHGGDPARVRDVCMDMSPAFRKGVEENLPKAEITYDRFHVMKLAGEAVDEVRRSERATTEELRNSRFLWLKNPQNLTAAQYAKLVRLRRFNLSTMRAYHMRLNLAEAWTVGSAREARLTLGEWRGWVHRSSRPAKDGTASLLEPMARVARTIKKHARGILNYFRKRLTSAVIEGFNSYVQAARARARGYRNPETFITMIYLLGGRLTFKLPALG
jgi:transposase